LRSEPPALTRSGRSGILELLHAILRRVRQWAVMILNPSEIAGVDKATANLAPKIMISLADATPVDALADKGAARLRFIDRHNRCHHLILSKK
jgi:hypothetical protein